MKKKINVEVERAKRMVDRLILATLAECAEQTICYPKALKKAKVEGFLVGLVSGLSLSVVLVLLYIALH